MSLASQLPTIHELPLMEDPKTPTAEDRKTPTWRPAPHQNTPSPDSTRSTSDGYMAPPNTPRVPRTGPLSRTSSPTSDDEALFSVERPDESPCLRPLRRRLRATHIDPRYLDRPIARPVGPRPVPDVPQRLKRRRHSEPAAVEVADGLTPRDGLVTGRTQPIGPRPLAASASVRVRRLKDPFVTPGGRSASGGSTPLGGTGGIEDEDGFGSGYSTPRASRYNKRRAVGEGENAED